MKKTALILALFCSMFCWQQASADTSTTVVTVGSSTTRTLNEIIALGLPVMYVETVDNEEPTCEYVSAPAGCMGATIRNATKVPGRLIVYQRIEGLDSVLYDSGEYEKDVTGMTIKLRGNTSAYEPKKPYKIKLEKKFDLLFGGNDSIYKDKEWLLLKDDYLTTIAGFKVNELVGMVWTPRHHFVNVIINDTYRGAYLLCESVKRNPDCRLNVDKNSGFIFECDPYWWNEDVYVTSEKNPSYNYTFKYPDSDDILPEQLTYMQSLVKAYEASLKKTNYPDLIDVRSFAAWCLVHDLCGTKDSGGANRYYTKYDTTAVTKIVMPLAWDFDMAERTYSAWSKSHTSHMTNLFNNTNRTYVGEFVDLWYNIRESFVVNITGYLSRFGQSQEGAALSASLPLNNLVYGSNVTVNNNVQGRVGWFVSRYSWLNNSIMALVDQGDVNLDGSIDIADVTAIIDMILNGSKGCRRAADMDGNYVIDIVDVTALISHVLGSTE